MSDREERLRALLEEYRDDGEVAVALLLRTDGRTQYLGPHCTNEYAAGIFQCAADAFNKKAAQGKVLN